MIVLDFRRVFARNARHIVAKVTSDEKLNIIARTYEVSANFFPEGHVSAVGFLRATNRKSIDQSE